MDAPQHVHPWSMNTVIAALESSDNTYPACCFPEVGRFLYDFVRLTQPDLVLETGTHIAYSALCIALAMEHNGHGHLHSFDVFPIGGGYVSPVVGACSDTLQAAQGHADSAGLARRITFHRGDSSSGIRRVLGPRAGDVDLAFLDADHTISGAVLDWNAAVPLVRPGGFVLLHDIRPDRCSWLGPSDILDKLLLERPSEFQQIRIPSPEGFGLGLLQKRDGSSAPLRFSLGDLLRDRLFAAKTGVGRHATWPGALRKWLRQWLRR